MASSTALDFTYRYPFASHVSLESGALGVRLATCGARREHPHFFSGRLREPRVAADMLLVLCDVVRTHFFQPRPANLDPVVTSSEDVLRFEGFSGCCGVYARADLPAAAFDRQIQAAWRVRSGHGPLFPSRAAVRSGAGGSLAAAAEGRPQVTGSPRGHAAALLLTAPTRRQGAHLVSHHGQKPASKRAAARIVLQPANGAADLAHHVLGQVGRVGVLQAMFTGVAVNQRRIEVHKLRPGLRIRRIPDADQ